MNPVPHLSTAAPLLTDDDVRRRVDAFVGPAGQDDTLWLLFVDGDGSQARIVMPVEDMPRLPDDVMLDGLGEVLEGVLPDLVTATGPGAVVLVRERRGGADGLPDARVWAEALTVMCRSRGIGLRGVHLATPGGVRRIP